MELTGRIIAVLPAQSGVSARTGNNWMSQDYVIEVPGQFPRKCLFRIFGEDRIKQFSIQQGEDLTVQFDIDAHEFNGRWFNDIRAYNIIRGQVQQPAQVSPVNNANVATPFPPAQEPSEVDSQYTRALTSVVYSFNILFPPDAPHNSIL